MIAYWMLYCAAVGVLLSLGALALERAVRPLGWATRWGWAAALVLTLAVPAAVRLLPTLRPARAPAAITLRGVEVAATVATLPRKVRPAFDPARLDAPLAAVWGASSAAVVLALAGMAGVLGRRRRRWARVEIDGIPVLVSGETGPAVVGLLRSRIVLPRWAVDADPGARRLVLEHEQEHVRAGDPRLLALALLVAALTPWNPAVWWQLRRLRLAVEVDCDARVLGRRADVGAYGAVLLEVGRRTVHSRLAAAAFAEPVSSLERRIRIMTAPRVRRPLLRAISFGAVAAALAAAACETPAPTQPSTATARALYRAPGEEPSFPKIPLTPRNAVARYFPQVLESGMGENERLLFVLAPDGQVVRHERIAAGADGTGLGTLAGDIPNGTIRSVDVMKRPAGELGPTRVGIVWVQLKGEGEAMPMRRSETGADGIARETATARFKMRVSEVDGGTAAAGVPTRTEAGGAPDMDDVGAAMRRFYTPAMAAAGLTGSATVTYTVGADGKARDVQVAASPAELEPVARQVVASLVMQPTHGATPVRMYLRFSPETRDAASR